MDGPAGDFGDEPTLIPARMLNEFVYCPRLFYLEWVDRLWADSHDTVQGHMAHDANDRRGGRMPPPAAVDPHGPRLRSRSATTTSASLR